MTVPDMTNTANITNNHSNLLTNTTSTESDAAELSFQATMLDLAEKYHVNDEWFLIPTNEIVTQEQLSQQLDSGNFLPFSVNSVTSGQAIDHPATINLNQGAPSANISTSLIENINDLTAAENTKTTKYSMNHHPQNLLNSEKIEQLNLIKQQALPVDFTKQFRAVQQQSLEPADPLLRNNNSIPSFDALIQAGSANQTSNGTTGFSAVQAYQLSMNPEGSSAIANNTMSINTPVNHPQWNQSVGQSVQWMINQNIQQADIKLNPPELGMLDIQVKVSHEQANITFTAANSQVRDAVEAAMPRLRELMEHAGLTLGDVNVSSQSQTQQNNEQQAENSNKSENSDSENSSELDINISDKQAINIKQGIVDTFA